MTQGFSTTIALADGTIFYGQSFGDPTSFTQPVCNELVFNTSMYGYQEILTDPSYAGQIVTFSYPHIGNVGCNRTDEESHQMHAAALICRNFPTRPSNFRSEESLEAFLIRKKKAGVANVDTRALVLKLRDHGTQMAAIGFSHQYTNDELIDIARAAGTMEGKEFVSVVSTTKQYVLTPPRGMAQRYNLACIDCGVKKTMLELLAAQGCTVTVFPYSSTAEEIIQSAPDAVFVSNGPGDPATLHPLVATVAKFIGKIPLFGICLGHQIIGQALGGRTYKLPFGHRGANHPVLDRGTGRIEITVQNHGFAIDNESIEKQNVKVSHINLNDQTVEGLLDLDANVMSVQYHPESSPGPHDARKMFDKFFSVVERSLKTSSYGGATYASK